MEFKQQVGKTPMLFMSLSGKRENGKVNVITIKDQSWRQQAVGTKALAMAEQATLMCGADATLKDVAALPTFTPATAVDYTSPMATLTVCQLVDPMDATPTSQLGDATEHLYQLNHVHVTLPTKEATIKTKGYSTTLVAGEVAIWGVEIRGWAWRETQGYLDLWRLLY